MDRERRKANELMEEIAELKHYSKQVDYDLEASGLKLQKAEDNYRRKLRQVCSRESLPEVSLISRLWRACVVFG